MTVLRKDPRRDFSYLTLKKVAENVILPERWYMECADFEVVGSFVAEEEKPRGWKLRWGLTQAGIVGLAGQTGLSAWGNTLAKIYINSNNSPEKFIKDQGATRRAQAPLQPAPSIQPPRSYLEMAQPSISSSIRSALAISGGSFTFSMCYVVPCRGDGPVRSRS